MDVPHQMDDHALQEELSRPLEEVVKGVPHAVSHAKRVRTREVAEQGWNLLAGDLPLPSTVIRESALRHNLEWMRRFTERSGVLLAPHGKTTMAPQMFRMQLQHGAWGITVATIQQLKVCRKFGVARIFFANQLVSYGDIEYVLGELRRDPEFEFYCLVDSVSGVERLQAVCASASEASVSVLLEVGIEGGRTGCRNLKQAKEVLKALAACRQVRLCGIECYEGIAAGKDYQADLARVEAFFKLFSKVYDHCVKNQCFDVAQSVLLSAGGSAYFDLAGQALLDMARADTKVLLRSGCYVTHDSLFYKRLAQWFARRCPEYLGDGKGLQPALEVWGQVQSRPEAGLAVLCVGKRDVSHDIEYPVPQMRYRPGAALGPLPVGKLWRITNLNDHHAYLSVPEDAELAVGDLVALGVSHPCTTFDKWHLLWLVDDAYRVTGAVWTYF